MSLRVELVAWLLNYPLVVLEDVRILLTIRPVNGNHLDHRLLHLLLSTYVELA